MRPCVTDYLRAELLGIHADLSALSDSDILSGPDHRIRGHFNRLDQLAALDTEDEAALSFLREPAFFPILEAIARLRRLYGLRLEIAQAHALAESADPGKTLQGFTFYPNYLKLAQTEYQGAKLSPGDRVVFLGSGPLPLSLIALCQHHRVRGTGIERDPEYAALSRQVIAGLELSDKIEILTGDHFLFPLESEPELVMVGAAAVPKSAIFAHLAAVLPPGQKLCYRIYEKGLRRILDRSSDFALPPAFSQIRRIRPEPPVNNTVVFARKRSE